MLFPSLLLFGFLSVAVELEDVSEDTFRTFVKDNDLALLSIVKSKCDECNQTETLMRKLGEEEEFAHIKMGFVNADVQPQLMGRLQINKIPSVFLFRRGVPEFYDQPSYQEDDFRQWISSVTASVVDWIRPQDAETLTSDSPLLFLASLREKESSESTTAYTKVAETLRKLGTFAACLRPDQEETVRIFRKMDNQTFITKDLNEDALSDFANKHIVPPFSIFSRDYAKLYIRPSWLFYAGTPDQLDAVKEPLSLVAEKLSRHNVVGLDLEEHSRIVKDVINFPKTPGLMAQFIGNNEQRLYFYDGEMGVKEILDFIDDAENDRLPRHIKSEPIPEENDHIVKVVVGKSFVDWVTQDKYNVVLLVHAPWCGHCNKFSPVFDEVAADLSKKRSDIRFLKFNGDGNDIPVKGFSYNSYPTLFLRSADSGFIMQYNAFMEKEALTKFIEGMFKKQWEESKQDSDSDSDSDSDETPHKDEL